MSVQLVYYPNFALALSACARIPYGSSSIACSTLRNILVEINDSCAHFRVSTGNHTTVIGTRLSWLKLHGFLVLDLQ